MRSVFGWHARFLLLALGNEDRAVDGFNNPMAWILAIHDRAAFAHLRIAHRFVETR